MVPMICLEEPSKDLNVQILWGESQTQSGDKRKALFQLRFHVLFMYQIQFPPNQKFLQCQTLCLKWLTETLSSCLVYTRRWVLFGSVVKQGIAVLTHQTQNIIPDYTLLLEKNLLYLKRGIKKTCHRTLTQSGLQSELSGTICGIPLSS